MLIYCSQVTGDHNLTKLHLDTALRQCQEYVLLNSTLQDENPAVTTIIINLCPNNCSNRGVCSGGIIFFMKTKGGIFYLSLQFDQHSYSHLLMSFKETAPVTPDSEEAIALLTFYLRQR